MTTRKRNEFLDPFLSDEDEASYDTEAEEESKGRALKRRRKEPKLVSESDDNDDDDDIDDSGNGDNPRLQPQPELQSQIQTQTEKETEGSKSPLSTSSSKQLRESSSKKKNKTGVIYLSSIPPYLKPSALRSMLEQRGFTGITRVFLTPYTPPASAPRRRSNKRKSYTDGWIEFASKRTAKICAKALNASIIGGRKGGWYHDDVWNMKYLRGFKWGDLMEQMQRERSEREAKRRIEDSRAKKEDMLFLEGVETGRVVDGIKKKNAQKGKGSGGGAAAEEVRRTFKQNKVKVMDSQSADRLDESARRVLDKIF